MTRESTPRLANLAGQVLDGKITKATITKAQLLSLAGSVVSQAERERESVKAWGLEDKSTGKIDLEYFLPTRSELAEQLLPKDPVFRIVPVLITRLRPAARGKRKGK